MFEVAKPAGLLKRGSRYYFRARWPADLVEIEGRSEYKVSLGTSDFVIAKGKRNAAAFEFDRKCEAARQRAASLVPTTTVEQIHSSAQAYVRRNDEAQSVGLAGTFRPGGRDERLDDASTLIRNLSEPDTPFVEEFVSRIWDDVFLPTSAQAFRESLLIMRVKSCEEHVLN